MPDRTSPLAVGEVAPASIRQPACASESGGEQGNAPVDVVRDRAPRVIAFHEPSWDPARADQLASISRLALPADDERPPQPILRSNRSPEARDAGVSQRTAVFVLDARDVVVWRYISGIDAMTPATESPTSRAAGWTRREFVAASLAAAVALVLEPSVQRADAAIITGSGADGVAVAPSVAVGAAVPVTLDVNGSRLALVLEPRVTLLDALREYAGLTGSKKGCDHGQCGACTVHIDGRRVLSCLTLAMMAEGRRITTIEGLAASSGAQGDALHPMQQAFMDHDGFQCGYCTSGQIMSACAAMKEPWGPGDDDVREAMSGNLCRCGAYPGIVAAVQEVRRTGGQTR